MHLRFSQELKPLIEKLSEQSLTIEELLAETPDQNFSLVMALLALPFLLPMPPGVSGISGGGCILLGLQMMAGRRSPWLPKKVAQLKFPQSLMKQLLKTIQWLTKLLERFVRPRLPWLVNNPSVWRMNGLCICWLSFLLILPIPLTNPIPTVGILLFVFAMLEADGLLMCVSYGMTLAITVAVFGIGYLLWRSPELFQQFQSSGVLSMIQP
ncbi:MAG: exopolysaccharide biosynthesis protein [Thermosynechococcaceae cyanobacterium MS004]|nr:exopolysaccharide biosynthesis protein [Thermosynechococcaceae cyanobacterium MS004]